MGGLDVDMLRHALVGIGAEVDQQTRLLAASKSWPSGFLADVFQMGASKEPHLEINLRGMVVIHKQPDWEVDGEGRACVEAAHDDADPTSAPLALSAWLRTELPQSQCPVVHDASMDFGFLHRLDVPSSGLILCGTTFSGLLHLRLQLDTYRIERQYAVWGHGLAKSELREVIANIDPRTIDSRRSFISDVHGKP